jgi:hypothetical protein
MTVTVTVSSAVSGAAVVSAGVLSTSAVEAMGVGVFLVFVMRRKGADGCG